MHPPCTYRFRYRLARGAERHAKNSVVPCDGFYQECEGLQLFLLECKRFVADTKVPSYFNSCVTGLVLLLASANTDSSETWPAFQSENKKLTGTADVRKETEKEAYASNPEPKRRAVQSRYASNPEPKRWAVPSRYASNPEPKRRAVQSRYASNPEPKRQVVKSRYASNPEPKRQTV